MANSTMNAAQTTAGFSLSQFFTTLSVSAAIAAIQVTLFIIIRTRCRRIYEPKTFIGDERRFSRRLPKNFYGWLPALLRLPQEDLIRTSGLDAYFFARYLYIHAVFFLISFVFLAAILFPVYAVDGKGEAFGKNGLDILTFGNILPRNSSRYGAPLVLAYVFIGAFLYLLYHEMKNVVEKRQALLRSPAYQSRASAATILVAGIPKPYMSEDALLRIFSQYPGGVRYIWLNRNLKDIPDKANKRTELVETLETAECKLIKTALKNKTKYQQDVQSIANPLASNETASESEQDVLGKNIPEKMRPTMRIGPIPILSSILFGRKVDTFQYCKETISELNIEIEQAKHKLDQYPAMNSAFILFNRPIAAHMAVQSIKSSIPLGMTPCYNDIKPANIIWSNLRIPYGEKKFRELLTFSATAALIIFWAIPVAFVGILSNLTYLTDKFTFLKFIYNLPPSLVGLITGLLPTILLAILMALLPVVLTFFAKMSGTVTLDAIDRYVQGSYFVFQVVHVFLVVTISSSVTSVITAIVQNPTSAAVILAANIPTASNFFFSFLALQGLSMASNVLLQVFVLISFYLLGALFDNTPRKKWQRHSTLSTINWGTLFPVFTTFVVISVVYSIITPLVLIISGITFALFYIAYIYNMFYVFDFPNDTGGLAFSRALYQSFTGIYLMEMMLAGLFFLAQNETGKQSAIPEGILMCILIVITIGVQYLIRTGFRRLTLYLPVDAEEFSKTDVANTGILRKAMAAVNALNLCSVSHDINTERNINDMISDRFDNTMTNAFLHPAIRDPKPIVWIPEDDLGIAANEIEQARTSELDIILSTQGARFDEKNNIVIEGPPPDSVMLHAGSATGNDRF